MMTCRLGCARDNQPYVVPVYLTYDALPGGEPCLYGFTTPGQKIEWMWANPLVCVEVDEVTAHDQWVSVIALGRYEELPEPPTSDVQGQLADHQVFQAGRYWGSDVAARDDPRLHAHQILRAQAMWWEPACTVGAARTHRQSAEPFTVLYYRVRLDRVTGHRATPDPRPVNEAGPRVRKEGWLRKALRLRR